MFHREERGVDRAGSREILSSPDRISNNNNTNIIIIHIIIIILVLVANRLVLTWTSVGL